MWQKEKLLVLSNFFVCDCFQKAVCCRGVRKRLYEGKGKRQHNSLIVLNTGWEAFIYKCNCTLYCCIILPFSPYLQATTVIMLSSESGAVQSEGPSYDMVVAVIKTLGFLPIIIFLLVGIKSLLETRGSFTEVFID